MPLLLNDLSPLHWSIAGFGIAAVTLVLLFVTNRRLGISTGFEDLCSVVLQNPFFARASVRSGRAWRLPFLLGLLIGGAVSAIAGGGWHPTWELGMLDRATGWGPLGKSLWMFAGGLCIGFGTRLAGGCTSGHGIFGLANLEWPSLAATLSFMASGIVTTQLLYRIVFS